MADLRLSAAPTPPYVPQWRQQDGRHYLWNDRHVETVDDALFDPDAWAAAGQLTGQASGRGAAYFLRRDDGAAWVLRHSRRGGVVANLSNDAYLWLGLSRCRVVREFNLLATLRARGLPVPDPVAARVVRRGLVYRGDLVTVQVSDAQPLADRLAEAPLDEPRWRAIGATVARFHRAGVYHHDLNARNILIAGNGAITLIDFDKSELRKPGRWCRQNLARLRRSLDKIAGQKPGLHFAGRNWNMLRRGYATNSDCQ